MTFEVVDFPSVHKSTRNKAIDELVEQMRALPKGKGLAVTNGSLGWSGKAKSSLQSRVNAVLATRGVIASSRTQGDVVIVRLRDEDAK